ncbi:helix-turn-helix domain-containing protein [Niabella terrae]
MMKKISIYVPEHGAIEAITPAYRLFNTANELLLSSGKSAAFDVEYIGLKRSVQVNDGEYMISTHRLLKDVETTDLILLPALYGDLQIAVKANLKAVSWIRSMYENGSEVASLCLGAFLLAKTGLLDGKSCSTHWAYYDQFRYTFPQVEVVDGSVITDLGRLYSSGGAHSLWSLLLYLLEKYADRDTAILAAKYFAIDIDRHSQASFTIFTGQKNHNDKEVLTAQQLIERKFAEKLSVDELAGNVNVSRRSFERRFKQATNNTVINYIQRVRVEAAKRSFEASRKNITEVMYDVGYVDTKAFRDVFKRYSGLTPIEYRSKYNKMEMEEWG